MRIKIFAAVAAVATVAVLIGANLAAQEPRRPPRTGLQALQSDLGLTDAQMADLRRIHTEGRKAAIRRNADLRIARMELDELLGAATVDEAKVAARVKAIGELQSAAFKERTETRLAVRRLVTAEQYQKMQQTEARRDAGTPCTPRAAADGWRARSCRPRRRRGPAGGGSQLTSVAIAFPGLASSALPGSGAALEREAERHAIAASKRGEREAFDVLVERYQRPIYRLCYRYVNNHEDASDLAQEAFLKAWRAIGRFRGDSAFSTWLYRIAVNACLNFRALRRPQLRELDLALVDPRPGAESRLAREDDASRVRAAVSRLPDRQRATLILKLFHDLTHEEVAGILGSSVGTVKANLFHALANLRREMTGSREARS